MQATVASWDWYNEDSASPLTVTKPSGFAAGEYLIAVISQHADNLAALTAPAGWVQEAAYTVSGHQLKVFSYPFKGGDPASWNFPYDGGADVCLALVRIQGAELTQTRLVINTSSTTALTASFDSPSVVPLDSNSLLLSFLSNICSGTVLTETDPAGMTDRGQTQAATSFMAMAGASETLVSAANTGVRTWTSINPSGLAGGTVTIAIKSAADIYSTPFQGISPGPEGPTGRLTDSIYPDVAATPSGDTNAPAETASSTGTAPDPSITIAVNPDVAASAGTGNDASPAVGAGPVTASGAGAAQTPGTTISGTSGTATGTGEAGAPATSLLVNPDTPTGIGAAHTPGTTISGTSGTATGSGTPDAPNTSLLVNPATAAGTGAALDATVTTSENTNAPAVTATGTGTAQDPNVAVAPTSGEAAATGTAQTPAASVSGTSGIATGTGSPDAPTPAIAVNPVTATGMGAAFDATVMTGSFTNADAQTATGTGTANGATTAIATNPAAAGGTGSAGSAGALVGVGANAATGAGAALAPSPAVGASPSAATGTGAALDAVAALAITANAATAGGTGAAFGTTGLVSPTPATATGTGTAYAATIGGTTINSMSTDFGPCPWTLIQCETWPTGSEAITGNIVTAATEVLWQKTTQRYGLCSITIRPCRESCFGAQPWPFNGSGWGLWNGSWPTPVLYRGLWYNIGCGGICGNSCSCTVLEETSLPGPVAQITEVKLDGVVMAPSSYRLDDNSKLVRVDGGMWPTCQDLSQPDTAPNTWSVTFTWGEEVPIIGQQALGQLAHALVRECMGDDCKLPKNLTSLARQGITITLPEDWLRRLTFVDLFLSYGNPKDLMAAPVIYDPDAQNYRRTAS